MAVKLYGFKTCDTVRKARGWLDANGIAHEFLDWRVEPLPPKTVDDWFRRAGWEAVFNRGSAAFRELPEADKTNVDAARAKKLILANGNFIKRPVLDSGSALTFGFGTAIYADVFAV